MFVQQALADQVVERLERQIRIDGAAAVADEQREMMHLARLAGFEHQADARARAAADQMMMQTRPPPAARESAPVPRVNAAVGENQDVHAVGDGLVGGGKQFFQRRLQAFRAVGRLEQNRQRDGT